MKRETAGQFPFLLIFNFKGANLIVIEKPPDLTWMNRLLDATIRIVIFV